MILSKLNDLYDSKGRKVGLGRKLGRGGEGSVYEIIGTKNPVVAKIYHEPLKTDKQKKLDGMVKCRNEALQNISTWPLDLLYQNKNVCGFIMPRVIAYEPIHKLYGPAHRKMRFPEADWSFLIQVARNLAAAFAVVHDSGHVIGDVNEGNVVVSNKALTKLIDCDSFQISHEGKCHPCDVGVAHFTPPEILKGKSFQGLQRNANHDSFGLAILFFHLLFMGRHPFSGRYLGQGEMPIERAIKEYKFAFSRKTKDMLAPPDCVTMDIVSAEISDLFEKSFSQAGSTLANGRPSAKDWVRALDGFKRELRTCGYVSVHKYYGRLGKCPWCLLESASGVIFFLGAFTGKIHDAQFGLDAVWGRIQRVQSPGGAPKIEISGFKCKPKDLPSKYSWKKVLDVVKKIVAVGIAIYGIGTQNSCLVLILLALALYLFFSGIDYSEEFKVRRHRLEEAQKQWSVINCRWEEEASEKRFVAKQEQLKQRREEYVNLEKKYEREERKLKDNIKDRKLHSYLDQFYIDEHEIMHIGPVRKATLASYGIETAADISHRKIKSIPGFGDFLTDTLENWRKKLESKFVFNPTEGIDPSEIAALKRKFIQEKKQLEGELLSGPEQLERICVEVKKRRQDLYNEFASATRELAQAHADLSILK